MVSAKEFAEVCKDDCKKWRQDIEEYQKTLFMIKERRKRLENDQKKKKKNDGETAERLRSARKSEKFLEDVVATNHRAFYTRLNTAAIHNPDDPELSKHIRQIRRDGHRDGHNDHGGGRCMFTCNDVVGWFARRCCSWRYKKRGYISINDNDDG